jgi:hypothetical protein
VARDEDDFAALPDDAQDAVAVLLPQIRHVGSAGLEHPQPEQSIAISAKPFRFAESRAAVSRASNCKWVNPNVGDSGGTLGRRRCSAGECSSTPSMTQVR